MRVIPMLLVAGLMSLGACSSSPTEPDLSGRSGEGLIVVPGHHQPGSNQPCEGMGKLAMKCVRK
jgi:hypothetical protein